MKDSILLQLVRQAADSVDLNPDDARVTDELRATAQEWESAVREALERLCDEIPCRVDADELMADDAPYLVYLTLHGEQAGIWDGRWDDHFADGDWYSGARELLEEELGEWVDDAGGGRFDAALLDAADETAGEFRVTTRERFQANRALSNYYLWTITPQNEPLDEEPLGPFALPAASQHGRIKAKVGKNDRVVSSGRFPDAPEFQILRRFAARTGKRLL